MQNPVVDVFDPNGRLAVEASLAWARVRTHASSTSLRDRLARESEPCVAIVVEPGDAEPELAATVEASIARRPHLLVVVCRDASRESEWLARGAVDCLTDAAPGALGERTARELEDRVRRLAAVRARIATVETLHERDIDAARAMARELLPPVSDVTRDLELLLEEPSLAVRVREDIAQVRRKARGLLADVRRWEDRMQSIDRPWPARESPPPESERETTEHGDGSDIPPRADPLPGAGNER